ncbi:hypothetical protein Aperf_G00000088078 [Anoplocephala perfoliata]
MIRALKRNKLDFTTGSPLAFDRRGSFDSLSTGGDLQPISDESMDERRDSDSTAKWFATVIESNGALSEQGPGKKPIQLLRLAIEELILTCITDQLDEIRNMALKRLQAFFKSAPLPISAVFCLRWIEVLHQTPPTNWIQQESLLKLIQIVVDKIHNKAEEQPVQEEISGSQLLTRRLSLVFANALNKKSPDESLTLNGRDKSSVTSAEEENIKKILLPKVRNLTLGMISNHRIPIRELAVSIYTKCVAMMHPENQAKILENALSTLERDISIRLDEIANNIPSNRPKLSQYLLESLIILCARVAELPNRSYCQVDWLQIASLCETMLSHPSQRVRDASTELFVAIFKIHKGSVQMARAVMVVLTQAWTSRQETLFRPFNQLPRLPEFDPLHEDKARECRTAWRSGHLMAFMKISQMLLAEYRLNHNVPLKAKKSILSPLFDPTAKRRFSLNSSKPISAFLNKSSDVNEAAPLLLRLKQLEASELRQVVWNMRSAASSRNSFPANYDTHSSDQNFSLFGSDSASITSFSSAASMNSNSSVPNNCCFRTCLTIALHAATECTCDPDRIIRHLAIQTLTEVAQVIGVFDHTLLTNIIMTHMSFEPTLLTYGCLEMLLNILISLKGGRVRNTDVGQPNTELTSHLSPSLLHSLLSIERSRVWLRSCAHYVATRETFDAVTLNSVQVVMCALTSVHQLGPLGARLVQMRKDALIEGSEEDVEEVENGYGNEKNDSKDHDQGFEDDSRSFTFPGDANHLDLDIDTLVTAVDSLTAVIQRLSTAYSSRNKESDSFGWLPDSPTRRRKNVTGVVYTASNDETFLEFTYLLLRRLEIPLQAYLCCTFSRSLSHVPYYLQPKNVGTVAVALSNLVAPLAFLAFKLYMEKFARHREDSISESPSNMYIDALREKCMITIINFIGLVTQCLPKTPVLGIDTTSHDFTESGKLSQSTMSRLESQVNSSAHVKETCDKFINVLHDIFNFARRNFYPKPFLQCRHWWWMGQLCSCVPNLCQASPGQVDTSRLVELLCNEISTLRSNNRPRRHSVADPLVGGPRDNRIRHQNSMQEFPSVHQRAKLNWMRVKNVSMAVAAFQGGAKRAAQQAIMEENNGENKKQSDSGDSEGESDSEPNSESTSTSSGCDFDDSKTSKDKARSGSESEETSTLSRQDFPPLSMEETSILVAKLIKCSDASTIEPLQNIIPRDIVSRVREMLEGEQRS